MKDISVVMPLYNAEKTVLCAVASVINQSLISRVLEIIVIDDGSTDQSVQLMLDFKKKINIDVNIRLLSQKNAGPSAARNKGMKMSIGKYIAFIDADDEWNYDKLEKELKFIDNDDDICLIGSSYNGKKLKRFILSRVRYIRMIKITDMIKKNFFQPSTVIIKRKVIVDIGFFNEQQKYCEDAEFFQRIVEKYKALYINESLVELCGRKPEYGYSGLSANLYEMEKGELKNFYKLFMRHSIPLHWFVFSVAFSILKFIRRVIICKFR